MTKEELKQFRKMVGLSQGRLADVVGVSRRTVQLMERGTVEIRNGIGLACAAYALGIQHYDGPAAEAQWLRRKDANK